MRKIKTIKQIRAEGKGKRKKQPKTLKGKIAYGLRLREKVRELMDEARNYAEIIGWDLAKRHLGDRKAFENAETIVICFMKYCEWVDDHPWPQADMRLYKGKPVDVNKNLGLKRPYTLSGFLRYCGLSMSFWGAFRAQQAKESSDLLVVIEFVEQTVRDQQIEGATIGVFKEGMVALSLGMKKEIPHENEDAGPVPEMKIYGGNAPGFGSTEAEIIKQLNDGKDKEE